LREQELGGSRAKSAFEVGKPMKRHGRSQLRVPVVWVLLAAIMVFCALGLVVALGGCGSVADVGSGASRAGVEPVRGAYGYGSGYGADAETREKRVEALARSNEKPAKKSAQFLKQLKQVPDEEGEAVVEVSVEEREGLDAESKTKLVLQEQRIAPSEGVGGPAMAENYGD
jgi:hypothetical protein